MIGLGAIVKGIGNIYTGITTFKAAERTAADIEYQGLLTLKEAFRDASITREEGRDFAATQSLQFIGSGVELAGSALITIAQTIKYSDTEAAAGESRGQAKADLAKRQAKVKRSEGRAALVGSIFNAGTSFLTAGV